jgi:class 3 adenylate cyclase
MAPPNAPAQSPGRGAQSLTAWLDLAVQRGERSVAFARLAVLAIVFLLQVAIYPFAAWWEPAPDLWLTVAGVAVGVAGTLWVLPRTRRAHPHRYLAWVSIIFDSLMVLTLCLPATLWPRELYPGQIHMPAPAFFMLATIAASLRLNRRALHMAVAINAGALLLLLAMDRAIGATVIPATISDYVLLVALIVGTAVVGDAVVVRTRRMVAEGAERAVAAERARQALGVYVSEEVADIALGAERLAPGGERREVAVLFSDLRGFTTYSETLPPEQLIAELNAYLSDMVDVIQAEGGVVDKYIGDAIMVVFGIPKATPDAAARAIRTAAKMQEALTRHNAVRADRGQPPLQQGVGVHAGEVVVGNVGPRDRMQYTVVGDAVNLASRLESATKELRVGVLVSEAAVLNARAVEQPLPPLTSQGRIQVKGRVEGVAVFSVQETTPPSPPPG